METITMARPYARAAFELASEQHALEAWSGHLAQAAAIAAEPRVAAMHNDPRVESALLVAMHQPPGMAADAPFARFLAVLSEHRRLALLPEVSTLFEALRRTAEHKLKARLRCPQAPDAEQTERLTAALKKRYHSDIELDVVTDTSMIGGAVLDIDGLVIDTSMRARLAQLQAALMR